MHVGNKKERISIRSFLKLKINNRLNIGNYAQNKIVVVLDENGIVMIEYKCDAWGNHAVVDINGADIESGIGVLNPFRYRGYYYDTETELYYLQTRYYDNTLIQIKICRAKE